MVAIVEYVNTEVECRLHGHLAAGKKLGAVGKARAISGTHVYFEMVLAGRLVDPVPYLQVPLCTCEAQ